MLKGDASWQTQKLVLGWVIDSVAHTLHLPPHCQYRLWDILASIPPTQKQIATKEWHRVLGELRSMVLAIPGGQGLFSTLQDAFRHPDMANRRRLKLTRHVHAFLANFCWLAQDLMTRPMQLTKLVKQPPATIGASDAQTGMGGVHFVPTAQGTHQPYLWHAPFPPNIQQHLVALNNPKGTITNSDLELAGAVLHHDIIAHLSDMRERTVQSFHNNTATVYWQCKGLATTTRPAAYLLRMRALHQRYHRYVAHHDYLPGPANAMADDCSRLWALDNQALLSHFNNTYPQVNSWKLCRLHSNMISATISTLLTQRSAPALYLRVPQPQIVIDNDEWLSATPFKSTHTSQNLMTPYQSCKSSSNAWSLSPMECGPRAGRGGQIKNY